MFSPRLNGRGNSVRGVRVLERLSSTFDLHLMTHPDQDRSAVIRAVTDADTVRLTLTGEIDCVSVNDILTAIASLLGEPGTEITTIELDLTSVSRLRPTAERFLAARSAALRAVASWCGRSTRSTSSTTPQAPISQPSPRPRTTAHNRAAGVLDRRKSGVLIGEPDTAGRSS